MLRRVPSAVSAAARTVWSGLLDLIAPPSCLGCGAPTAGGPVCGRCLHRLERADPSDLAARLDALPHARDTFDDAFALWVFDKGGVLQRIQHALKYGNRPAYGHHLGALVGQAYRDAGRPHPDLVTPVPLHRTRLYERGYNQSAFLAEGLAEALGAPCRPHALRRLRATRSQTRLSRRRRWENVSGAFAVTEPEAVVEQRVLLVDDVLTTGATATAAALALREAGAAAVGLATLALARE